MKRVSAIIVAAGEGKRFGSPKQFSLLRGKPVLEWCLKKFEAHERVDEIILVLPEVAQKEKFSSLYKKVVAVVEGGRKRQDSVVKGFAQVSPEKTEIVLVHDGIRPLVGKDLITRVIDETLKNGAAIPALQIEETVKEVEDGKVIRTMNRTGLYRVQTPQGFSYSILKEALERATEENFYGTDEAMLVERIGRKVFVVQGDPRNIKITNPADIKIMEALFEV
jgi:2-C-methyl-D-erythritol 4-phosphate cytidylyltransferase